jgi:hypothetical protein
MKQRLTAAREHAKAAGPMTELPKNSGSELSDR